MRRLVPVLAAIASSRPELGPFEMQHGATPLPDGWSGQALIGPLALTQLMARADIVIMHGGPATIGETRAAGKVPIVVPRRHRFDEHVDDHQYDYALRLAAAREILLVEDERQLPLFIDRYPELVAALPPATAHDAGSAVASLAAIADRMLDR